MANVEDKIEQYFLDNIKILRSLNKLLINDISSSKHLLTDKIYDFVTPIISNYDSFSILKKMLGEYIYNLSISKTEKEYFVNKLYKKIGDLSNQPYIDVPDCVDRKSLCQFEEEYYYSIGNFLLGYLMEEVNDDKEFRAKCIEAIKEKSEVMTILFIKDNLNKFSIDQQKLISSKIKKYLRRRLSIKLVYPIIDMHYFLMLTPKEDFQKQISRESAIENIESDLVEVCTRILERNQEGKSEDEINDYISDLLRSKNYNISDQTRSGVSMSKKNAGEIDIMIRDEKGLPITILECLKLTRVSPKGKNENLVNHFTKLIDNYDSLGLSNKYLIVYVFAKDFEEFKRNYRFFLSLIRKNGISKSLKLDSVGSMRNPYGKDVSNLVYIPTFHRINGVYQKVTHYLINLNLKNENLAEQCAKRQ
ncbi:hypothetical protein [Tenacibaculum sp. 47A_GOM-205m]|uniref:hypothetical protein n=1 Tax=Tenacibaculum sp. 47A_GOM-205m TaxID=1380384 RepID=UPI0004BC80C9|nr:hypothetical protein [Tenacibaculum sp. 47A_GOM-205m]